MDLVVSVVAAFLVIGLTGYALYLLTRREPVLPDHFVTTVVADGGKWSWRCRCGESGETTSELARIEAKAHLREVRT